MKRTITILWAGLMLVGSAGFVFAQDAGVPDTLYVEIYPEDYTPAGDPPYFVRFPIYVTHDIVDPVTDSLAGFVIPLYYWQSNTGKYCSTTVWWNTTDCNPFAPSVQENRSIFRHLPSTQDPQTRNRMMDMASDFSGREWDFRFVNLYANQYDLVLVPTGSQDQCWWEGSRVLLATMTFKLQDSMTVCIDSFIWMQRLSFSNSIAQTYIPRHFLPVCETIIPTDPPPWVQCPGDQSAGENGQHTATGFSAESHARTIQSVDAQALGDGLGTAWVENVQGLGTSDVEAEVVYEVTDHCGSGGTVTVTAYDDIGRPGSCSFTVTLENRSPGLALPESWRALADHIMHLEVRGIDPDGDPAVTWWNGIWHETDPGRYPVHYPSYQPGNPGELVWDVTESDTGSWISSFSAVDNCGLADTQEVNILVGFTYCGDCTGDGTIDMADVICLINYLFKGGDPPEPLCRGDANCNGERDAGDIVLILNFLFKNSFAPCFECCAR
jgi:hypothetical protein